MIHTIMGYWVTDDPTVFASFVQEIGSRYDALEQALEPITVAIADLERNWSPRSTPFWHQLASDLTTMRRATTAGLLLFAKEQSSRTTPVPLFVAATSREFVFGLQYAQNRLDEAGVLITAYTPLCKSYEEQHIRQRQRVLHALQELEKITRVALVEGRTKRDQAHLEQQRLMTPPHAASSAYDAQTNNSHAAHTEGTGYHACIAW